MVNPIAAPSMPKCRACTLVASPADVTIRLYSPELTHLPLEGAVEYLRAVGLTGTVRQLQAIALTHRRHVDKFIERGGLVSPGQVADGVSKIPPPMGDTSWVDLNQSGMNAGAQALARLEERMRLGALEDEVVVQIAKMGQSAAQTRATLEMKGALKRAQSIAQLASGFKRPEAVAE